jgi:hypothetical protein
MIFRIEQFRMAKSFLIQLTTENKPRHATTSSRSVEMIFRNYNPKPVSDARRRY